MRRQDTQSALVVPRTSLLEAELIDLTRAIALDECQGSLCYEAEATLSIFACVDELDLEIRGEGTLVEDKAYRLFVARVALVGHICCALGALDRDDLHAIPSLSRSVLPLGEFAGDTV